MVVFMMNLPWICSPGNEKVCKIQIRPFWPQISQRGQGQVFFSSFLGALSDVLVSSCWTNQVAFAVEERLMNQASVWIKDEKQSSGLGRTGIPLEDQ